MVTRDLSNRRVQLWVAPASAISSYDFVTDEELAAMLMLAPAIRWDGLDLGMQPSEQIDDRSLDDDATATIRGFMQFGGGLPIFFPRPVDQSSILRQAYNLFKVRGTELVVVERIGWSDRRVPGTAGDNVNIYKLMTDGYTPDTEGTGGYAYLLNMLPRGEVSPWSVVAATPAAQITLAGGAFSGEVGDLALRRASYIGNDITSRATWVSSDQDVAVVNDGIIELVGAGTASVTATYPGGTTSAPLAITSAAA